MFWICVEQRVDDIKMFLLLLSSSYAERRCFMAFYAPHTVLLAGKLGVHGNMGGDTTETGTCS